MSALCNFQACRCPQGEVQDDALAPGEETLIVSSLICHGHVEMACVCLRSLVDYSAESIELNLMDDGSLTIEDVAALKGELPIARIVSADEAENEIRKRLHRHPALLELRSRQVLVRKAVDCVIFAEGPTFRYCDTDILFLRPFHGLFDPGSLGSQAVLMRDAALGYSVDARSAHRIHKLRLPFRGNSGILCFDTELFDLDEMNALAATPILLGWQPLWEQTIFALIGGRNDCRIYDSRQIRCITERTQPDDPDLVAAHFYSPIRWRMPEFTNGRRTDKSVPSQKVKTYKPSQLNGITFLVEKAAAKRRKWGPSATGAG
jgi:hypothetical protein